MLKRPSQRAARGGYRNLHGVVGALATYGAFAMALGACSTGDCPAGFTSDAENQLCVSDSLLIKGTSQNVIDDTASSEKSGVPVPPPPPSDGVCGQCPAQFPICDGESRQCVGCLSDADCGGSRPTCDTVTLTCRGCIADSECTDSSAPLCHRASGRCGACLPERTDDCGGTVCDSNTLTCTDAEPGSAGLCETCAADAHCLGPAKCVTRFKDGDPNQPDGSYCLDIDPGCNSDLSTHPDIAAVDGYVEIYMNAPETGRLLETGRSVSACAPPDRLTCEAWSDRKNVPCDPSQGASACGRPETWDAVCIQVKNTNTFPKPDNTYRCALPLPCIEGADDVTQCDMVPRFTGQKSVLHECVANADVGRGVCQQLTVTSWASPGL